MTDGAGNRALLAEFSKEQLLDLIELYAKNWLALDGVWFQSVEQRDGMDAAMLHGRASRSLKPSGSRHFCSCRNRQGWKDLRKHSGCAFTVHSTQTALKSTEIR